MNTMVWVGSYTDESLAGIHVLDVDPAAGELRPLNVLKGIENPTYLALNRARTRLYTVCSRAPGAPRDAAGAVAAYAIEGASLRRLNMCPTPGSVPCHLSLAPDEQTLVFAEYAGGHAGLLALDANGALASDSLVTVRHKGRGPDPVRQESAHAHFAAVTPDGRWLTVCDLGLDQVILYDFAHARQGLRADPARAFHAAPGAGPRHLRFHPNGRLAFLLNELDSTVVALRYTGESFEEIQTIRALPDDFAGESKAAALKVTPDGRCLITSNRGFDSLTTFAIDPDSGRLERLAISPLTGSFPRDFELLPDGRTLLVGHKLSNEIVCYAFDPASGAITRQPGTYPVHRPTCIVAG